MAFRAPLLGYNTNVRHKGKLYHIQTEDSGVDHPHVITHLFADGGRIVASKKTSYAERVGSDGLPDQVKKLMQGQHKAMFIALRDGTYDEDASLDLQDHATGTRALVAQPEGVDAAPRPDHADLARSGSTNLDGASAVDADPTVVEPLPEHQVAHAALEPAPKGDKLPSERAPLYRTTQAALRHSEPQPELTHAGSALTPAADAPRSLFGGDLLSDKSLDEVILNYLAANEKDG